MRRLAVVLVALVACGSPAPRTTTPTPTPVPSPPPEVARVPDPNPPGVRGPGDVKPTRCQLELTIVPDAATAHGKVAIDAEVVRPTRVVWLNATGLTVTAATLGNVAARVVPGGDDYVGLTTDRELPVGPLTIAIDYTAPIDHDKSRGIYAEKEGAESYAYTFFEAIDARRAFPSFDEPAYKIPWQLTFHVKRGHVALGNAPVVAEHDEPGDMKRVELAESKPLPAYLVAFVVGPFEVIDDGTAGRAKTPIRFVIPKGRAGELGYAKLITPKVVAALEDYFGMAYPYGKLDVAVVPRFWGTMEHPGIVAMGQPLTLIAPDQATRSRRERYTNILAHELSHYWFGDYVTMAWWDDTWLNEALGEWMDLVITDAAEPSWHVMDDRVGRATSAMTADEALSTKSIRQPVTTREGIQASFDGEITYLKGSTVLRMFETYVGRPKWQTFIREYLDAHKWGNATADDLLGAVKAKLGPDVERGLRSFLEQPGVPRIATDVTCKNDHPTLALHQRRSLPAGAHEDVARTWTVPVCVRYGDATHAHRSCTMLAAADGELALDGGCPTWVIANADAYGYYRSVVDPAIAMQLLAPGGGGARGTIAAVAKPTTAEKLMLVADVRAAVERDELALDKVLALAPVLAKDPDPKVAQTAFVASELRTDGLDDATHARYLRYATSTFAPLARQLGWKRLATDSDDRHRLRQSAMGLVAYEDAALAKQAQQLALAWLADRKAVDDDMVGIVLSAATRHGDDALFARLHAAARAPRDRTERQRLLASLGGFTDPAIVAKALAITLGTELDLRDSLSILEIVLYRRETKQLGVAFVEAHADELLARMRDDEASWFLGAIAGGACDAATLDRLGAVAIPRAKKVDGAQAAVDRSRELGHQCIASTARQAPALEAFLDRGKY